MATTWSAYSQASSSVCRPKCGNPPELRHRLPITRVAALGGGPAASPGAPGSSPQAFQSEDKPHGSAFCAVRYLGLEPSSGPHLPIRPLPLGQTSVREEADGSTPPSTIKQLTPYSDADKASPEGRSPRCGCVKRSCGQLTVMETSWRKMCKFQYGYQRSGYSVQLLRKRRTTPTGGMEMCAPSG